MSTGIGLGLERLGLWTLRFPRLFALFLLVFTGGLVMALPGLRFHGDILAKIDEGGPLWREYETLSECCPSGARRAPQHQRVPRWGVLRSKRHWGLSASRKK